jgi:ATP-dependent phosphofructokinase / diphosphate-dependent phosphofructokinase
MSEPKCIGILTGGGDCPGLNAVIRGAVHRLVRRWGVRVVGSEDAFNGLLEDPPRVRDLGLREVSGILGKGGTILGTTNRGDPFAYPVRRGSEVVLEDLSAKLAARVREHDIDGLLCVGGDGTLAIAKRLMDEHKIPVIGVPKTIDNDVGATDYTFGFWTAVQIATQAIDMLHTTAEAHDRVMVVELMGRDAGHLALAAGLAGGADVILIPEIPYDPESVVRKIEERRRLGLTFSIIAVAEGAFPRGGNIATEDLPDEQVAGRLVKLGGIGRCVARQIAERTGCEVRVTVLGHLQRGGSPVAFDRVLATSFGVIAADAAMAGEWGRMVALRTPDVVTLPLEEGIRENHKVDLASTWIAAARGVGICLGDE